MSSEIAMRAERGGGWNLQRPTPRVVIPLWRTRDIDGRIFGQRANYVCRTAFLDKAVPCRSAFANSFAGLSPRLARTARSSALVEQIQSPHQSHQPATARAINHAHTMPTSPMVLVGLPNRLAAAARNSIISGAGMSHTVARMPTGTMTKSSRIAEE
jgi:hypothetical protein